MILMTASITHQCWKLPDISKDALEIIAGTNSQLPANLDQPTFANALITIAAVAVAQPFSGADDNDEYDNIHVEPLDIGIEEYYSPDDDDRKLVTKNNIDDNE